MASEAAKIQSLHCIALLLLSRSQFQTADICELKGFKFTHCSPVVLNFRHCFAGLYTIQSILCTRGYNCWNRPKLSMGGTGCFKINRWFGHKWSNLWRPQPTLVHPFASLWVRICLHHWQPVVLSGIRCPKNCGKSEDCPTLAQRDSHTGTKDHTIIGQ